MTEPSRLRVLAPYRGRPPDVRYGRGEHAAVCRWCYWTKLWLGDKACFEPTISNVDEHGWHWTYELNEGGKCTRYHPTLQTRFLQWLRLRPWVERPTQEDDE